MSRNPFQGGMGFFTGPCWGHDCGATVRSQSLSGWDGVFHLVPEASDPRALELAVAIPFRVGWGFSLNEDADLKKFLRWCRNPFQGGMGFSRR